MSRKRVKIGFLGYDGKVKINEGKKERWVTIGRFNTKEEAYSKGATKLTPKYQQKR